MDGGSKQRVGPSLGDQEEAFTCLSVPSGCEQRDKIRAPETGGIDIHEREGIMKKSTKIIGIILLVIFWIVVLSIIVKSESVGNGTTTEPATEITPTINEPLKAVENAKQPERPDKIEAWVMAEAFVKKRLRSPSTADFGGITDYQDPKKNITIEKDGIYKARGWVDAQNVFGATVRETWLIIMKYAGDGNWQALEGPFLGEDEIISAAILKAEGELSTKKRDKKKKGAPKKEPKAQTGFKF